MVTARTGSKKKPFLFGKLPYDVRAIIYELGITRTYPLEIAMPDTDPPNDNCSSGSVIPHVLLLDRPRLLRIVLRLNKAINEEAMPFLYAHNTFSFNESRTAEPSSNQKSAQEL